ncbi:MAG: HD domain-containing protein, partial [Lachnospiraceae bacterium]|nr:HD domain-containing protein [Lachnospiraceae bacterium]
GALYHHERYDGNGYMEGLKGEEIPLVARIICVADALDAMSSDRCYRAHLTKDVILSELRSNKGTQFDPKIAQIMIDMIENGEVFVGEQED